MNVFESPSVLQMGERNEGAHFRGAQDLTDEIIIHDRAPIFAGTYSFIYRGTCYGYPVSLTVLTSRESNPISEVAIKVLNVTTGNFRTVGKVSLSY